MPAKKGSTNKSRKFAVLVKLLKETNVTFVDVIGTSYNLTTGTIVDPSPVPRPLLAGENPDGRRATAYAD